MRFYTKAFEFAKRGIMNGPGGKPVHAELTLRGTTLMVLRIPRWALVAPNRWAVEEERLALANWEPLATADQNNADLHSLLGDANERLCVDLARTGKFWRGAPALPDVSQHLSGGGECRS